VSVAEFSLNTKNYRKIIAVSFIVLVAVVGVFEYYQYQPAPESGTVKLLQEYGIYRTGYNYMMFGSVDSDKLNSTGEFGYGSALIAYRTYGLGYTSIVDKIVGKVTEFNYMSGPSCNYQNWPNTDCSQFVLILVTSNLNSLQCLSTAETWTTCSWPGTGSGPYGLMFLSPSHPFGLIPEYTINTLVDGRYTLHVYLFYATQM